MFVGLTPAATAAVVWRTPTDVSGPGWTGLYPQIASSGETVMTAYSRNPGDGRSEVYVARTLDNGATWLTPTLLSTAGQYAGDVQIAVSGTTWMVIWWTQTNYNHAWIESAVSTDAGEHWTTAAVSGVQNQAFAPQITKSGSTLIAAYTVFVPMGVNNTYTYRIETSRSTDLGASWGNQSVVSTNASGGAGSAQLATNGNTVGLVYREFDGTGWGNNFTRSTDYGATWSAQTSVTNAGASTSSTSIRALADGFIVMWDQSAGSDYLVKARRSTDAGATWDPITQVSPQTGSSADPSVAVDGNLVIATWQRYDGSRKVQTARSSDAGATWSTPQDVGNGLAQYEAPMIAVANSHAAISWTRYVNSANVTMVTLSEDAGVSWSTSAQVSDPTSSGQSPPPITFGDLGPVVAWQRADGVGVNSVYTPATPADPAADQASDSSTPNATPSTEASTEPTEQALTPQTAAPLATQTTTPPISLPGKIKAGRWATLLSRATMTNAGQRVRVHVSWDRSLSSLRPNGDVSCCSVLRAKNGRVSVFVRRGFSTKLIVNLHAPSTAAYLAFEMRRTYRVQ